jgi:putative membrane protein
MFVRLLIRWLIMAVSLFIVSQIIPGIHVTTVQAALIAAVVVGFLNATLGTILKILTFPFTILTLGLFWLVINAAMLGLAASLVNGFTIDGPITAFIGSIVLSLVNLVLKVILPDGKDKD